MLGNLLLSFFLTFAFIPSGVVENYEKPERYSLNGSYYFDIEGLIEYKKLFIHNSVKTMMWRAEKNEFYPHEIIYSSDIGIQFDNIRIGSRHTCFHPIIPKHEYILRNDGRITPRWEGGYTEIYIKIGASP